MKQLRPNDGQAPNKARLPRRQAWRRLFGVARAVALPAAVLLTACGPGVGGTGTDSVEVSAAWFDAQPVAACAGPLASALGCSASLGAGAPADAAASPPPSRWVSADGRVVLVVQADTVALEDRCSGARFDGRWGQTAAGAVGAFGNYAAVPGQETAPVWMTVIPVASGSANGLSVRLQDPSLSTRLGPIELSRSATVTAVTCPGAA